MEYYAEEMHGGQWRPVKYGSPLPEKPPKCRFPPIEIPKYFADLTLSELREVLGPGGKYSRRRK